jgi:hypothetical protein
MMRKTTVIALLALLLVASVTASSSEAGRGPGPKVLKVWYLDDPEDGWRHRLEVDALRTHALRFAVRHRGRNVGAKMERRSKTGDRSVWAPTRDADGRGAESKRMIRAFTHALDRRGRVRIRIRAKGNGRVDDVRGTIVRSECYIDPPLYPGPDCTVKF